MIPEAAPYPTHGGYPLGQEYQTPHAACRLTARSLARKCRDYLDYGLKRGLLTKAQADLIQNAVETKHPARVEALIGPLAATSGLIPEDTPEQVRANLGLTLLFNLWAGCKLSQGFQRPYAAVLPVRGAKDLFFKAREGLYFSFCWRYPKSAYLHQAATLLAQWAYERDEAQDDAALDRLENHLLAQGCAEGSRRGARRRDHVAHLLARALYVDHAARALPEIRACYRQLAKASGYARMRIGLARLEQTFPDLPAAPPNA
jgi:hypothetical protein